MVDTSLVRRKGGSFGEKRSSLGEIGKFGERGSLKTGKNHFPGFENKLELWMGGAK